MKRLDLVGYRFGRLVVSARAENRGGARSRTMWSCRCDCGTVVVVGTDHLRSGDTLSCGCLHAERTSIASLTHGACVGHVRTPEYKAWLHAKGRCFTPTDGKYPDYGGRGITMCAEWANDFTAFLRHVGPRPSTRHSLDRIEVNGHYEPGNVRWATPKQQMSNMRQTIRVRVGDEEITLKELARRRGVDYKRLHKAVRYDGLDPLVAVAGLPPRQ